MVTVAKPSDIGVKPPLRDQPVPVKILIVDDRPDKLLALTAILEELGQNLVVAHSGQEALRLLLRDEFAVILLDVNMPVMDGFETASLVRQCVRTEHTPIIFISAISPTETHASKGYSLGAVDYIFAPVIPAILRAKILVFIALHHQTKELARNEELFRRIFNEAPIGMALLDEGERFQKVNQAFSAMLGYESEALSTMTAADITHPGDRKRESKEAVRLARGEAAVASLDKRYLDRDGKEVWASTTTIRILGSKAKESHRLVMAKDITDKQHIQELERLTYQLQRTNAELEQFAYIAAHDLQEPIRMIGNFLHLLEREMGPDLSPRAKEYFAHVTGGAERMKAIVHSVLEFSRIDADSGEIALIDTDDAVRHEVAVLAETIAASKAVIDVGPLPSVRCRPAGMSRLIQNLLSNALKFRSKDTPVIRIAATASDGWVTISVRDNGIGIPASQGDKLFILFQRLHTRNEYPGTGIGLASCKKIVENHGGHIWFESKPRHGSEFFFTLPSADAHAG